MAISYTARDYAGRSKLAVSESALFNELSLKVGEGMAARVVTLTSKETNDLKAKFAEGMVKVADVVAYLRSQGAHTGAELAQKKFGKSPEWQAGDVVLVKFDAYGKKYTYVRGSGGTWPGESQSQTDEQITKLWREGKVTPVLQQGGMAFNKSRLSA